MESIAKKIALVVSILTTPFISVVIFGLITIWSFSKDLREFLLQGIVFLFGLVLMPLAYICLAVLTGRISDFHLSNRGERIIPFLISVAGSAITLSIYYLNQSPSALLAMVWALAINGIVFTLITVRWKISVHIAAFAGSVTTIAILVDPKFALFYPLIILIAWARLARRRHSPRQLLAAALLSSTLTAIVVFWFR